MSIEVSLWVPRFHREYRYQLRFISWASNGRIINRYTCSSSPGRLVVLVEAFYWVVYWESSPIREGTILALSAAHRFSDPKSWIQLVRIAGSISPSQQLNFEKPTHTIPKTNKFYGFVCLDQIVCGSISSREVRKKFREEEEEDFGRIAGRIRDNLGISLKSFQAISVPINHYQNEFVERFWLNWVKRLSVSRSKLVFHFWARTALCDLVWFNVVFHLELPKILLGSPSISSTILHYPPLSSEPRRSAKINNWSNADEAINCEVSIVAVIWNNSLAGFNPKLRFVTMRTRNTHVRQETT